jgi:hypothetical protein
MGSRALPLGVKQLGHGADCIPSYVELKYFLELYLHTVFHLHDMVLNYIQGLWAFMTFDEFVPIILLGVKGCEFYSHSR